MKCSAYWLAALLQFAAVLKCGVSWLGGVFFILGVHYASRAIVHFPRRERKDDGVIPYEDTLPKRGWWR